MWQLTDYDKTLQSIVALFNNLGVRFHLTGGIVSIFYGEPRLTQDIDLVVKIDQGKDFVSLLVKELSGRYLFNDQELREAVRAKRLVQLLDSETSMKIDLHVGEAVPGELARSRVVEVLPGIFVPVVSKEDAIISKLLWAKRGSHKSRRDIRMMLMKTGDYDRCCVDEQARCLGLADLLSQIEQEDEIS